MCSPPLRDAKTVAFRGIERQRPDRVEIQAAGARLHIAPVAADVKHVNEAKRGELFDLISQLALAGADRERGTVLFPRVAD